MPLRRVRHHVGVHLVLVRPGRVLLALRRNTGFADGRWHPPGGGLEHGESLTDAAVREAREELGIIVAPGDLTFAHLCHHRDGDDRARIGVFLTVRHWTGDVVNAEPRLCAELRWFDAADLPADMIGWARAGVRNALDGMAFAEHGWAEAE